MKNTVKLLQMYISYNNKNFDDKKNFYLYDRFFESNQNSTTERFKIVMNSRFFSGFQVRWQPCLFNHKT